MAGLVVTLKLDRSACLEHESVWFDLKVVNSSKKAVEDLPALDKKNLAVEIILGSGNRKRKANQFSARSRDGASYHAPERPKIVTLGPGESLAIDGDLLDYFGGIRAGQYKVAAVYEPGLGPVSSEPVSLTVHAAKPVAAATPRFPQGMPGAPIANAWVHEGGGTRTLLYQEQSPLLPPNPRHGYRVPGGFREDPIEVAKLPYDDTPSAHLLWAEENGAMQIATVNREKRAVAPPHEVKVPFSGIPLASPQSMQDGSVWIPFADPNRERYAAIHAGSGGRVRVEELRIGTLTPIASYVNLWDYDANLFFAWSAPKKPEVRCAVLSLTEPGAHFKPLFAHGFDAPVVWLDGYVDLGEDEDRHAILWCVRRKPGAFHCCKFRVHGAVWITDSMLLTGGLPELTLFNSVVGSDRRLGLLFSNPAGELWYGSTKEGKIVPVLDRAGKPVLRTQSPGLLAAGTDGVMPWIYLRYIDAKKGALTMLKIEPAKEPDPAVRWER